jgi:hypothetical protein
MADDEIILCSLCVSKKDCKLEDEQDFIFEINEYDSNVEDICIRCIEEIFNRYFWRDTKEDEICFNIIMKSNSIMEKLTKICNSNSTKLLAGILMADNLDFAEMLIENCNADIHNFNLSISRFNGDEYITEKTNNPFLNVIASGVLDNKIEVIKLLIDHGANIEYKNAFGYTFDHYLDADEKIEIMEFIEYVKLGGRRTSLNLKPARN